MVGPTRTPHGSVSNLTNNSSFQKIQSSAHCTNSSRTAISRPNRTATRNGLPPRLKLPEKPAVVALIARRPSDVLGRRDQWTSFERGRHALTAKNCLSSLSKVQRILQSSRLIPPAAATACATDPTAQSPQLREPSGPRQDPTQRRNPPRQSGCACLGRAPSSHSMERFLISSLAPSAFMQQPIRCSHVACPSSSRPVTDVALCLKNTPGCLVAKNLLI